MKDYTRDELLDGGYKTLHAGRVITFCLEQIYADNTHCITDRVTDAGEGKKQLTYEELIGALLAAQMELLNYERMALFDKIRGIA